MREATLLSLSLVQTRKEEEEEEEEEEGEKGERTDERVREGLVIVRLKSFPV